MVKKWHYLALKSERIFYGEKWCNRVVTSFSRLLRGMTSNHHGDFNCLNCYHSHSTETRLKKHEEVCNEYDHCYTKMPTEDEKILKYKHGEKSLKAPFLISFDNEVLLPKMSFSQNNPDKSQTEKKAEHIPSGCAWLEIKVRDHCQSYTIKLEIIVITLENLEKLLIVFAI